VTAHQIALAFLILDPNALAIPKSARVERVRQNAAAAAIRLGREEIVRLDEAFPVRRGRSLPTL